MRLLRGFVQLLGSGVLAAAGLAAVASNRWQLLDGRVAIFLLLFIQWQSLSLTVAKSGFDVMVFATASRNAELHYDVHALLGRRIAPLAGAMALVALVAFPPWAATGIGVSAALDGYSLVVAAEMNARSRFGTAAFANLLNYPLFFLLLFLLSQARVAGAPQLTVAFVATSAVRAAWLAQHRSRLPATKVVVPTTHLSLAAQQAGNYVLFRADQLLLGVAVVPGWLGITSSFLGSYLYLAKLPEFAAGVMNTAGTVLFPVALRADGLVRRVLRGWRGALLVLVALATLVAAGTVYVRLWRGSTPLALRAAVPFLAHSALILPANAVTYSMLSRGFLTGLLRFIFVGLCAGAALVAVAVAMRAPFIIAWVVPLQLATVLGAAAFFGWGGHVSLYGESGRPSVGT